jgi:FkbM family methyltransferase
MRMLGKAALNQIAGVFGARLVGANWGPRGFKAALERARSCGFSPQTVLDVGASDGTWTRECRTIFPDAIYFLADPLEENRSALDAFAGANNRLHIWHGAIGAQHGEMSLTIHGDQSSFLDSAEFGGSKRIVPVRTLDSFIDEVKFRAPVLLKADVQGFELEVLKGAARCIEMTEAMLLEVSFRRIYDGPLANDVITKATNLGFRIYDIVTYSQRGSDSELAQADIVFARESSQLFSNERWK